MKDITLKITGKQCYDNHEEEQMEFVTDGKIYVSGGAIYIVYDESDVSGLSGCKTTLKVSGDSLKTVSYTHLDVYKRQRLYPGGRGCFRIIRGQYQYGNRDGGTVPRAGREKPFR